MHNTAASSIWSRVASIGDRPLRLFQAGVVVALLLVVGALVLWAAGARLTGFPYLTENLRVIERSSEADTVEDAYRSVDSDVASNRGYSASKQPEGAFWLSMPVRGYPVDGDVVVELRMLRSSNTEFWKVSKTAQGDLSIAPLRVRSAKGGTAVHITLAKDELVEIIGRVLPIGVARPKVFLWDEAKFKDSERLFDLGGGALLGAFLMLAVFSAFVGGVNRDWSFFLFSGWLVTSLRVASINDGWDPYWLGINLDNDDLLVFLRLSLAAHALLTVALFRSLLAAELRSLGLDKAFIAATAVFSVVLVAGLMLPHRVFLPLVWSFSALGIALILFSLVSVVIKTRTSVSLWYAASWGLTFLGILTEVGYASGMVAQSTPGLNVQSASIASALLTAVSLAEKLRHERHARLAAERDAIDVLGRFKDNYNSMPIGLFSISQTGDVMLFNPAFASMFALPRPSEAAPSLSIDTVLGAGAFERLNRAATAHLGSDVELQHAGDDESNRWFLARVTSKGNTIEGSIQDISTRKDAETQLRHLVDHDHLTGLLNRRGLEATIARALDQTALGLPCALAYIDLDRFKLINDLHGHGTGDSLLQQSAVRLSNAVREGDSIARIADSFVVVFFDCPDHSVAGLTERIRDGISEAPFDIDSKGLNVTVSVGVVALERSMSFVDAMAAADRACSEAKARGRNCVVRLNDQDSALRTHLEELQVVADLQQRVPTERYFLEFQPIVALQSAMSSLNYEVLIRMRGENNTVIPPGKFIGAAERNGLMSNIDRWVLRSTLEWLDDHPEHRERLAFATINISGASLNDTRFVSDAFSMIAEHPFAMTKLCFEITESVALHDIGSTQHFVDRVRAYGSKVALDDFGAGYTSFNYLKEIPADFIKIDGSFVKDINRNPANYAITRTIVDLTHELGMRSIAEWAETPDTIASLIELGVDYGQGFGLVRPISPDIVTAAVSSGALVTNPEVITLLTEYSATERRPQVRRIRYRNAS